MGAPSIEKNTRMQAFVEHFIRTGSVRESVKAAGYNSKTLAAVDRQGQYLMTHAGVQAAIAKAQQEIKAASRVGTEEKRMALWDIVQWHSRENPDSAIRAIRELNEMDGDLKAPPKGPGIGVAIGIEQLMMMVTQQQ